METRTEIKTLNQINFCGLEGIKCGDALYYTIQAAPDQFSRKAQIKNIARIFRSILFGDKIKITYYGKGHIVFLFSNSYYTRNDYRYWFDQCVQLCKNVILIEPKKRKLVFRNLRLLHLVLKWHQSCVKKGLNRKFASFICGVLCDAYIDYCEIIRAIMAADSRLLISVCDTHLIDSLVTQRVNQLKIDTASLQHGHFEYFGIPWVMSGSYSKYYLIYGEYSRRQFLKSDYTGKLVSVGMPALIGEFIHDQYMPINRERFGVILGGNIDDDIVLLQCAENLSKMTGSKYDVKLHPGKGKEEYGEHLESDNVKDIYYMDINVFDFSDKVHFAIGGITTVFIDYMVRLYPMFIYRKEEDVERFFAGINWCMFDSAEQLYHLYTEYIQGPDTKLDACMKETRELLSVTQDVEENYHRFLKSYDIQD